jgi:hypothetical protein
VLLACLVVICASVLISTASLLDDLFIRTSQPFESGPWKAGGPADVEDPYHSPRSSMIDDLLARELLIGRTQGEVLALLGEPGSRTPTGERETRWEYWISSGLVDPIFLAVSFGLDGTVREAWTFET